MFLMYVDESGDTGLVGSPTSHFILSGLVVHERDWNGVLASLLTFRRDLKARFDFPLREEIHASHLISRPKKLDRFPKHIRLEFLRRYADQIARLNQVDLLHVVIDKANQPIGTDVFNKAWQALIQRFENTIRAKNFKGSSHDDDRGMVFPDRSDEKKLNALIRKMRAYNPVPHQGRKGHRSLPLSLIIEDTNMRNSVHSYFIQTVDVAAYLLYQQHHPSAYFKRKSGHQYFSRMDAVLCKVAAPKDPQGIVRL
jgi:hypothetical protein